MSAKFFAVLFILSGLVWIGAASYRTILMDHLFIFGSAEFKAGLLSGPEREVYYIMAQCSVLTLISYPVVLLSGAGFISVSSYTFKSHGWMLLSAILLYSFIPVEIYTSLLDWKLVGLNFWGNWELTEFRKVILQRVTALSGAPFLASLSYYTVIIVLLLRPMKIKSV